MRAHPPTALSFRGVAEESAFVYPKGQRLMAKSKLLTSDLLIRPAILPDLPRLTEIYNHYVIHTPITFDLEPKTVEARRSWFEQFAPTGRYRLLVAEEKGAVGGYAGTTRFRPKAAYDTT